MRSLWRLGSSAVVLWVGVPLAWLWIASQIQGATDSLGAALGAAFLGVVVSIAAMVALLSTLSDAYRRARVARGLQDTGNFALEVVMVMSAGVAIVLFTAWFFLFAGSSPIPLSLGY